MLAVKVEMEGRVCEDETGGVFEPVVSQGRWEMEGSMMMMLLFFFFPSTINTETDSVYLMIRNQDAMGCFSGKRKVEDVLWFRRMKGTGVGGSKENDRAQQKKEVDCLV